MLARQLTLLPHYCPGSMHTLTWCTIIPLQKKSVEKVSSTQTKKPPYGGQKQKNHLTVAKKNGADTENRTRDLTLTKGALYQLSHISTAKKWRNGRGSNPRPPA